MSSVRSLSRFVRSSLQKSTESSNLSRSGYGTRITSRRSFVSQSEKPTLKNDQVLARVRPFWKTEDKWWPYLLIVAASGSFGGIVLVSADAKTKEESPHSDAENIPQQKKRILILGTGWAGISFLKDLDASLYDVTIVSPRNYFVFTPLLPSVTSGTVEAHSITEPVRRIARNKNKNIKFCEAECLHIDAVNKMVSCRDTSAIHVKGKEDFTVDYDYLIVALGAQSNTFGIPGVKEYCHFLKEVEDAERIHQSVLDCFETASLPHLSDDEKKKLLHFVVIGGGPTGVEFAAELHDLIYEDLLKLYPGLAEKIKITVVQGADHILNMFDERISSFAEKKFQRQGVEVQTGCFVKGVTEDEVTVKDKSGQVYTLSYGMAVWSTGIGTRPVVSKLMEQIGQKNRRVLATDEWLRVKGCENTYALGDCATIEQRKIMEDVQDIFKSADVNNSGKLTIKQFKEAFESIKERYPQINAYLKANHLHDVADLLGKQVPEGKNIESVELCIEDLKNALGHIDSQLKLFPATAQVAAQQGAYLARCFNNLNTVEADKGPPRVRGSGRHHFKPFQYRHLGQFAPLGEEQAAAELPGDWISIGRSSMWLWYSVYLSKQISWRTRCMVAFDWSKRVIFGRDSNRM